VFHIHKVLQTLPEKLDSSAEWEPLSDDGVHVRFKSRYGQYLRANKGVPPWRNSITHDIPSRTVTQDWVMWTVDVLQIRVIKDDAESTHSSSTFSRIEVLLLYTLHIRANTILLKILVLNIHRYMISQMIRLL